MNPKERHKICFSLSPILPLLLSCGWYSVSAESRSLEASTVATYQKTQLEAARRAAQTYIAREIEALEALVKPLQGGKIGEWIHSPHQTALVGVSATLPALMQESGAYAQVQSLIVTMSVITVVLLALLVSLRRSRADLKASEARYRAIVEDQMEMICRFRCDGKLTFVNQAYADMVGATAKNLAGANVFDLIPQSELPKILSQLDSLSPECPVQVSERQITTPDQQVRWQQWIDRAILNSRGQVVEIQSVGRDITSRKLYEAEIERLAFTDPLTGLANRRRLYDIGQHRLRERLPSQMALIYLDLDRFKPINDTLGHDAGDELLIQVAERLRSCIRKDDILARLGGDEFAILLVDSELKETEMVSSRILAVLNQPFYVQNHTIHLGGSLGIATTTLADVPFSQLLTQADIAMYRAKSQGRGGYVIFDATMYAEVLGRRRLAADLQQAIEQNPVPTPSVQLP